MTLCVPTPPEILRGFNHPNRPCMVSQDVCVIETGETVMKGTEALSLELTFDRLLERLLRTCIETASAERAVLAVVEGGLVVRATGDASGVATLRTSLPARGWVPISIVEQ